MQASYYVYDPSGNVLAIYNKAGSNAAAIAELPVYGSDRIGTYYASGNNYVYELRDNVGSVRVVIARNKRADGSVDVLTYSDYYPFGSIARNGGNGYRYEYQGAYAEKDPVTGYNNFDLRMYDGRIGRWLSVDPMGQYDSPYLGMGNNPVTGSDPTGGETASPNDWYKNIATGAFFWRDGNASSVTINGLRYDNVGSTFAFTEKVGSDIFAYIGGLDGSRTLLNSNEYNMVRFPESGVGFQRYTNNSNDSYILNGVKGKYGDNWSNPKTAVSFYNTIQNFHRLEPGVTIHYGDISAYNPNINLGHKTHNAGNSIDIHYFDETGKELRGPSVYKDGDVCLVSEFIGVAVHNGFTRNYSYGSRYTHVGNNNQSAHKDHFHIGR